jgi:hypothetical protein
VRQYILEKIGKAGRKTGEKITSRRKKMAENGTPEVTDLEKKRLKRESGLQKREKKLQMKHPKK